MREVLWEDRKRHLGMPLSFTKYSMTDERLYVDTGLLNLREDEVLLYRVRDTTMTRTLWQRIFRVGTITVMSSDVSIPKLELKNIAHVRDTKELLNELVEDAKNRRRMRPTELLDAPEGDGDDQDLDGDGIPDSVDPDISV